MNIVLLQWNIGGGLIRFVDADPSKDESYCHDGIEHICNKIKEFAPDIITFQESHADANHMQAEYIVKKLGYEYFVNDAYDLSH